MENINFDFEKKRKLFHLSAIAIPALYLFFLSKTMIVTLLFFVTSIVLYLDMLRTNNMWLQKIVNRIFCNLIREEEASETRRFSGMSAMMLGFFCSSLFFSKGLAITSWFILIISDSIAALIGVKFGDRLSNGKSLEGSISFLISSVFISMIMYFLIGYKTSFFIIIMSSLFTTIVEFYSGQLNINDNLAIPLAYCFCTTILLFLLQN